MSKIEIKVNGNCIAEVVTHDEQVTDSTEQNTEAQKLPQRLTNYQLLRYVTEGRGLAVDMSRVGGLVTNSIVVPLHDLKAPCSPKWMLLPTGADKLVPADVSVLHLESVDGQQD